MKTANRSFFPRECRFRCSLMPGRPILPRGFLGLWVRPGKRAGASLTREQRRGVAYPKSRPQTAGAVRT